MDEADIKSPHKITYYCERRDPDFDNKIHNVLLVNKQLEFQFKEQGQLLTDDGNPILVLSYDKKPGIQAVANTSDGLCPYEKHSTVGRDYEYKRLETLSLMAEIDPQTGEAIPLVSETHNSRD